MTKEEHESVQQNKFCDLALLYFKLALSCFSIEFSLSENNWKSKTTTGRISLNYMHGHIF